MSDIQDFVDALRPASFRGVPFATLASRKVFGRRTAVHEYPFRDTIWVEDLGRKGREISLSGFLVANSLVYGGGDVLAQQDQLIAAAEHLAAGQSREGHAPERRGAQRIDEVLDIGHF
jgi:prophage DNA circulation protein